MPEHEARIADIQQAARLLRLAAGRRHRDSGRWTEEEQVYVDLAIRLEALLTAWEDVALQGEPAVSWQPIETAPTDGTPVIVHDEGATFIAWFSVEDDAWIDNSPVLPPPSHWMPLPPDPAGEASPSRPMADIALCTCQVISGGAVSLNLSCPLHGISLGHKLSAPMASGLLLTLKSECEAQHARAELAEQQIATLRAERDEARRLRRFLERIDEVVAEAQRADAAEARAIALEAALVALRTLLEQRASRFFEDHGEVDTEYVAVELRALLSPPPPSQETT